MRSKADETIIVETLINLSLQLFHLNCNGYFHIELKMQQTEGNCEVTLLSAIQQSQIAILEKAI